MRETKKILAMVICAMAVLTASAQGANNGDSSKSKTRDEVQYGIRAGMNVSNMKYKDEGYSEKGSSHVGYHVGFIVDVPVFRNNLYIQPGMYLTQKGYRDNDGDYKYKELPTYLDFPLLISGRYTFGVAQLQVNFGPYFACGLFGDAKESYLSVKSSEKLFNGTGYQRFDAGLSVGAGVLLQKHYYIGFQYEIGMTNLYRYKGGASMKNRNCMITVGYNF